MAYRVLTFCLLWAFGGAVAWEDAPLAADDKKESPEVVIYFQTRLGDTKDTRLPKGTRIRLRVEAGDYDYGYDGTTIEGETVEDIAFQVQSNMAASGWNAVLLKSGLGVAVYGCATRAKPAPQPYKTVTKAGIHYSGDAQPIMPGTQGKVQLLILDKGKWKSEPEKKK